MDPKDKVNVYVIDTGVYKYHPEFENRVILQKDFTGEGEGDDNGHGNKQITINKKYNDLQLFFTKKITNFKKIYQL